MMMMMMMMMMVMVTMTVMVMVTMTVMVMDDEPEHCTLLFGKINLLQQLNLGGFELCQVLPCPSSVKLAVHDSVVFCKLFVNFFL